MWRIGVGMAIAAALGLGACRTTEVISGDGSTMLEPTLPAPPEQPGEIPTGTTMNVRLGQAVGAKTSQIGDTFTATVDHSVVATDGTVIVPAGAVVSGKVTHIEPSERVGDPASIALDVDSIRVGGEEAPLEADVIGTDVKGAGSKSRAGVGAAIGGAAGAVLGGIIGEWTGALVGGLVGAGAGTLIGLGTGEVEPKLPAGTQLSLRTTAPTRLAASPGRGPT